MFSSSHCFSVSISSSLYPFFPPFWVTFLLLFDRFLSPKTRIGFFASDELKCKSMFVKWTYDPVTIPLAFILLL